MRQDLRELVEHGFTMRLPAGRFEKFSTSAADSIVGTFTEVNARELGIDGTWRMKIIAAEVVDDGDAIELSLRPERGE